MKLAYKPDFEQAKEYWRAFWAHELLDRPCLAITAPKEGVEPAPPPPYLAGAEGDFEQAFAAYEAFAATHYFAGEAIPYFDISLGPDQFSACLGGKLEYGTGTAWVNPFVEDLATFTFELKPDNPDWLKLQAFYEAGARYAEGKFLLGMQDLHSNFDTLAACYGPERTCLAAVDTPELVDKAMAEIRALYVPFCERIFEAGAMYERGFLGWIPTYSETPFAVTQCDYITLLSPEMARRWVIPALEEETAFLDHTIYHLDGPAALPHLENILALEHIDGIQWVPGAGNPPTYEWLDLLKRIQQAGKALHLYDWGPEQIRALHKELDPSLVFYQLWVNSEREADELLEFLRRNT